MYVDKLPVDKPNPEIMGLPGIPGLCILDSKDNIIGLAVT